MPTRKIAATKNTAAKKAAARKAVPVAKKAAVKKAVQPAAVAATFRMKIDLANLAVGAKTVKQLTRAMVRLAQTLARMDENGTVRLEQPVTAKGAYLATTDVKAAKRFGMEEGRAPRGAKTAAPAAKTAASTVTAAESPAPVKKAASRKTRPQAAITEAAPASEAADMAAPAVKKRGVKKASAKKAARKTGVANGPNKSARAVDGLAAAAPKAPLATSNPGRRGRRILTTSTPALLPCEI